MEFCNLCLSTGRKTSPLTAVEAFRLITGCFEDDATRLCWECEAMLSRLVRFRSQAARAMLLQSQCAASSFVCLSRLGHSTKSTYDAMLLAESWGSEADERDTKSPLPLQLEMEPEDTVEDDIDIQPKMEPEDATDDLLKEDISFEVPILESAAIQKPARCKKKKKRKFKVAKTGKNKASVTDHIVEAAEDSSPETERRRRDSNRNEDAVVNDCKIQDMDENFENIEDLDKDLVGACARVEETREEVVKQRLCRLRGMKLSSARHVCTSCALSFRSAKWLERHVAALHVEDGLQCPVCDCRAADPETLTQHSASHCAIKCNKCRFRTRNKESMRRHVQLHERDKTMTYSCDICGKQFKSKQYFNFHRDAHVSDQRYECDMCGRVYSTRVQIFRHLKHHRKPFLCDICGKAFSNKTTLRCHSLAHSGAEQRPFECEICHRRYVNRFKLETHARFHTGEKPYACTLCDGSYREKAQLAAHVRKHHPDIAEPVQNRKKITERTKSAFVNKPYVEKREAEPGEPRERKKKGARPREKREYECNVCGKKLKDRWRLKFHLSAHSNERPYKCDECDLTFKYPQGVWTHKLIHQGVKQHQCNMCGAQFTQKGNLTSHMKIHNNERPHECAVCGNKFRARRDLRKHAFLRHATLGESGEPAAAERDYAHADM